MTADSIFAQDVILDPDTGRIFAVVRTGGVWREGTKIAVLVGTQLYDLNGNLLGTLAAGDGSLPISFKNLVEGESSHAERAWSHSCAPRDNGAPPGEIDRPQGRRLHCDDIQSGWCRIFTGYH